MSSENQYRRFAVASLDLSERGKTLVDKSCALIVAEGLGLIWQNKPLS